MLVKLNATMLSVIIYTTVIKEYPYMTLMIQKIVRI